MYFKAVIFDLDGTLLDTLEDIGYSMNRVLSDHGFPTYEIDRYRYFVGDGVSMLVKRTLPPDADKGITDQCVREFHEEYDRNNNKRTKLYDGMAEALDGLSERGMRLAVLSNKTHDAAVKCVKAFLSGWEFEMVLGLQTGIPRKPDPAGALRITEFFKMKPEKCLYVGDTGVDMRTALAAGMYPAGALWGFRTEDELHESGALALMRRPQEILHLIGDRKSPDNRNT